MLAFFFFCPILAYFLLMTSPNSLPFGTHIRGHMVLTPLPSPLPCLPSFWSREKNCSEISFLLWRHFESNWFTLLQPTSILRSTQAARRFLRSVCMLTLLLQALILTGTNTRHFFRKSTCYGLYLQMISYRYHAMYRMVSVSRYPEYILDIDIDVCRKYRMIYREFFRRYRTPLPESYVPIYGGTQVLPAIYYIQLMLLYL